MKSPLYRLYKTKLTLLAVICIAFGVALLFLTSWAAPFLGWAWLNRVPAVEFGVTLLFTGLVTILFQFYGWRDAQEYSHEENRKAIRHEAPAFVDAVVEAFAFKPESVGHVVSADNLDRIIENCLGLRLGDSALAHDVYTDLRTQVVRAGSRNYDAKVSVVLSPWSDGPSKEPMLAATICWEYQVSRLSPVMRFSCVSDQQGYRELLRDPTSTTTWLFTPTVGLDGASTEAFELVQFEVDGKSQRIRRTSRAASQTYSVSPERSIEVGPCTVTYTYRALVRTNGRLLYLDIAKPTKGLSIDFQYGGCGIDGVRVLDYIASAEAPRISRLPAPTPRVSLRTDSWVWPKSGVAFFWSKGDAPNRTLKTERQ